MCPLGFFLLNYVAAFITWYKLEKKKTSTIFFPLFNLYPIYGTVVTCSLLMPLLILFRCIKGNSEDYRESFTSPKNQEKTFCHNWIERSFP